LEEEDFVESRKDGDSGNNKRMLPRSDRPNPDFKGQYDLQEGTIDQER